MPVADKADADVEVGAVEIKDATTDTRAKVKSDGTDNALVVTMNAPASGGATAANQTTGNNSLSSIDTKLSGTGSVKDNGPGWTSVFGVAGAAVVSADITSATAITDAPTTDQKIVLTDLIISTDTAMNILIEEETSGTDIFKVFLAANSSVQITPRGKCKLATVNKKLTAKGSVSGNVALTAFYYSEA